LSRRLLVLNCPLNFLFSRVSRCLVALFSWPAGLESQLIINQGAEKDFLGLSSGFPKDKPMVSYLSHSLEEDEKLKTSD
jgi:hypothetical protein